MRMLNAAMLCIFVCVLGVQSAHAEDLAGNRVYLLDDVNQSLSAEDAWSAHQRGLTRLLTDRRVGESVDGGYWIVITHGGHWKPGEYTYVRVDDIQFDVLGYWWVGSDGVLESGLAATSSVRDKLWYRYEMFSFVHGERPSDALLIHGTGRIRANTAIDTRDLRAQLELTFTEYLLVGGVGGLILGLILFHLFIAWQLRDPITLIYLALVAVVALTEFSYLGVLSQWFTPVSPAVVALFSVLAAGMALFYCRVVLGFSFFWRSEVWGDRILLVLWGCFSLGVFTLSRGDSVHALTGTFHGLVYFLGFWYCLASSREGSRIALVLLLGWAFGIATMFAQLGVATFAPASVLSGMTWFCWASIIQVLIFACVLPLRIRGIQRDRDVLSGRIEEQFNLFETTEQINEDLQEEVNAIAAEVGEETALLERLRESTRKITEDLEQAQLRLSQAEKLASLGQLIVGVSDLITGPAEEIGLAASDMTLRLDRFDLGDGGGLTAAGKAVLDREVTSIRQMLGYISKAGDSIVRLNAALVNYSSGVDEEFADVSMEELIEDTCLVVHGRIRRHRLELNVEGGSFAHCCRGQIERVLGNLLTNAADAIMGDDESVGEPGVIRVLASQIEDGEHSLIRVVVEDSGPGIPDELRDAVMRPFYTTKSPARGTGLGLYICRGIVMDHKGTLSLSVPRTPPDRFGFVPRTLEAS